MQVRVEDGCLHVLVQTLPLQQTLPRRVCEDPAPEGQNNAKKQRDQDQRDDGSLFRDRKSRWQISHHGLQLAYLPNELGDPEADDKADEGPDDKAYQRWAEDIGQKEAHDV